MDCRMLHIDGVRPHRLRRDDLPLVARALVHVLGGDGQVNRGVLRNVSFVELSGLGYKVVVMGEDWERISPLLADGYFDAFLHPPLPAALTDGLNPAGSGLYARILAALLSVFPDDNT